MQLAVLNGLTLNKMTTAGHWESELVHWFTAAGWWDAVCSIHRQTMEVYYWSIGSFNSK